MLFIYLRNLFDLPQCLSAGICHQSPLFELPAPLPVELCPVAAFPSGRQSLCKASVRKFLQGGIYPSEAKGLFHNVEVRQSVGHDSLSPAACHPAEPCRLMVLLKPLPQLLSIVETQQVGDFHSTRYVVYLCLSNHSKRLWSGRCLIWKCSKRALNPSPSGQAAIMPTITGVLS